MDKQKRKTPYVALSKAPTRTAPPVMVGISVGVQGSMSAARIVYLHAFEKATIHRYPFKENRKNFTKNAPINENPLMPRERILRYTKL
jgi:hypothetical protein